MMRLDHAMAALCLLASLSALSACKADMETRQLEPSQPDPQAGVTPGHEPVDPAMTEEGIREHAGLEPKGQGELKPLPTENVRLRRRLDLDQLDASIRRVTGGLGWTEVRNGQEVNLFDELASTMGKPDFINSTSEDLDPSIIFQKFLGDAARTVCDRLTEQEVGLPLGQGERHLFIKISHKEDPRQVQDKALENLKALSLNFHGRFIQDDDDARLKSWSWLLESTLHTGATPEQAWRAVCVGMMTHPDFYMY